MKKINIWLALVLLVTVSIFVTMNIHAVKKITTGILLNSNLLNEMKVGGELGWFYHEENGSTGYTWHFTPDNSGVYRAVEEVVLLPSVNGAVGVPGSHIWKFKALRKGRGKILFDLYRAGEKPVETVIVQIEVK